jgi:hypothetical protein
MQSAAWVLAALFVGCSPACAQARELQGYPELMQKSDLVAIAECQGASDTGARYGHPDLEHANPAVPVQEWRATLRVTVVLKAYPMTGVGSTIGFSYLRFDDEKWRKEDSTRGVINGGWYVVVKPGESYLLFLKAREFGVYEPVTGHLFPNDSVYLLDPMSAIRH